MIPQDDTALPGVKELWAETTGSSEVLIAVLDGARQTFPIPALQEHPCALRRLSVFLPKSKQPTRQQNNMKSGSEPDPVSSILKAKSGD